MWYKHVIDGIDHYTVRPVYDYKYEAYENVTAYSDVLNSVPDADIDNHFPVARMIKSRTPKQTEAVHELPFGYYTLRKGTYDHPVMLVKSESRHDTYVPLPSIENTIINDLNEFLTHKALYEELNLQYKTGILLHGKPGEGKTTLIRKIINDVLPKNAIVINVNSLEALAEINKHLKQQLKEQLKVFIFEEVTQLQNNDGDFSEFVLNFLDGEFSLDNSISFLTTNYADELPGNVVDRPSRIDRIYEVGSPNAEERKLLLEKFLKREVNEEEIKVTDGLSTAYIKELCITSQIKKISIEATAELLRNRRSLVEKKFKKQKFGL